MNRDDPQDRPDETVIKKTETTTETEEVKVVEDTDDEPDLEGTEG